MKCPLCEGEFDTVTLKTAGGKLVEAHRCQVCGGFWLEREPDERLTPESVGRYDTPQSNYSLKAFNLICPNDQTLLREADREDAPAGLRFWECPDCRGTFFTRGQLSLLTEWQDRRRKASPTAPVSVRGQAALASLLSFVLVASVVAASTRVVSNGLDAAVATATLPSSGPNVLTLVLLGLTYIAGTILAVLGRRLPLILLGWGVIILCLLGFAVIIFGP